MGRFWRGLMIKNNLEEFEYIKNEIKNLWCGVK